MNADSQKIKSCINGENDLDEVEFTIFKKGNFIHQNTDV